MQRVSALLPSWDKSKTTAATTNTNNNTTAAKAKPKPSLVSLDKVFGWVGDRSSLSAKRLSSTTTSTTNGAPEPASSSKEAYWPTALDKECEKAARILKSFCTDGFLAQEDLDISRPTSSSDSTADASPKYVSKKIPPRIIQNAVGLAIFSCMRSGLWMSGSGGSGILIARKADGTWSPPSGIILHTAALGFALGVDIYDCVLVINSVAALEVFMRPRTTLGADVSLTVGPLTTTGLLENELKWKELEGSVLTYLKARGQHQHVPLDGSLVTERSNENERFYGNNVNVLDVLAGNIQKEIPETRPIFEVIKAAEGRTDFDTALMEALSQQPAPGDVVLDTKDKIAPLSPPRSPFGVPNADDPDPFGVIALEMAGLEIREAGTRLRPASSQFEFHPASTSPLFSNFQRQSIDTYLSKSNRSNRGSVMSSKSQGTQTDIVTPETTLSRNTSDDGQHENMVDNLPTVVEPEEIDYTQIDMSILEQLQRKPSVAEPEPEPTPRPIPAPAPRVAKAELNSPPSKMQTLEHNGSETDVEKRSDIRTEDEKTEDEKSEGENDVDADDEDDEEDFVSAGEEEDDTIVYEIATATAPARAAIMSTQVAQVIQAKGALVTIPKRIPPPLPARSPARTSRVSKSEFGDVAPLKSPLRTSFQSSDVPSVRAPTPAGEYSTATSLEVPKADAQAEQATNGFLNPETSFVPGHRKQASYSSAYLTDEERMIPETSFTPPTPQMGEATSSGDEEREPVTPRVEDEARPSSRGQHTRQTSKEESGFVTPSSMQSVSLA